MILMNIGFGSFNLEYVCKWLQENFEVVENDFADLINRLQAENERLNNAIDEQDIETAQLYKRLDKAKAEAYKEFAERLKMRAINRYNEFEDYQEFPYATISHIDELLKELIGE